MTFNNRDFMGAGVHSRFSVETDTKGQYIHTPGVDWSGRIEPKYTNGSYQIWKKYAGTCWRGIGCARAYVPMSLWIVKIADIDDRGHTRFTGLHWVEPGRKGRVVMAELIQECDRLAAEDQLNTTV